MKAGAYYNGHVNLYVWQSSQFFVLYGHLDWQDYFYSLNFWKLSKCSEEQFLKCIWTQNGPIGTLMFYMFRNAFFLPGLPSSLFLWLSNAGSDKHYEWK